MIAEHPASRIEGFVLLAVAWLAAIAAGLLAPVLPGVTAHFRDAPFRDLLIGFVATGPALMLAVCAVPFGWIADRIGARPVLIGGMLGYGFAGMAPIWLGSLPAIALSRAAMGVCEAAAMTAGTAMIGLAFPPATRGRWLAAQVGSANVMGIVTAVIGGWAGRQSWRAPFWAYGFALLLLPFVIMIVRERRAPHSCEEVADQGAPSENIRDLILLSVLTVATGVLLIALMVETSFLLASRGVTDTATIGLCIASAAIGTALGAAVVGAVHQVQPFRRVGAGYAALAAGLSGIVLAPYFLGTLLFALIGGIGIGLIVPSLLATIVGGVGERGRGRAAGAFTASLALGQFLSPLLFIAMAHVGIAVREGLLASGLAAALLAAASLTVLRGTMRHPGASSPPTGMASAVEC